MAFNINELRETLELNRSEIMHNHLLTNEYLIDDIMRELGYNKRRNKNVKRLLDKPIDWEVLSTGSPRIAIKVFALGDTIDEDILQEAIEYCKDKIFSIFIVTNGEEMTVCRYNKVKREYAEVCDISLLEELNDTKKSVIEAISNDGFNLEIIDNIVSERDISPEKVKEVLKNNLGLLASHVATWLGDSSNSKIEQCKVVIGSLFFSENVEDAKTVDVSEYTTIIEQLQKELEEAKQIIPTEVDTTEYTNIIAELQNKVAEYEAQLNAIKESSNNESEESQTLMVTIEALQKEIEDRTEQIEQLESEVASLRNSSSAEADSDIQSEIDAYRAQIQELAAKVAESDDEIAKLKAELKEAHDSLNNMSGADKQKAVDLLNIIEDSSELPRSYVAVVNTELMQYDDLPTFVGRALQKLYEIKNYEASQFIFNGDIFKLVQPAVRNDLIMNNKAYDVRVEDIHEDEVLNKLRVVYSHFSEDVLFECKKIGSLDVTNKEAETNNTSVEVDLEGTEGIRATVTSEEDSVEVYEEVIEETFEVPVSHKLTLAKETEYHVENANTSDEAILTDIFGTDNGSSVSGEDMFGSIPVSGNFEEDTEETFEDSNFNEDFNGVVSDDFEDAVDFGGNTAGSFEESLDDGFEERFIEEEFVGEPFSNMQDNNTSQYLNGILCSQLLQIDDLIWTNENVVFNNIKYVGSSSMNFNINMYNEPISNEQLFCKCLDAVLALAVSMGNATVLQALRQSDLSQVNSFIKLYTEEYANYPRINGTKFAVVGIESVSQVASVLADICTELNIDASDIFLYFDVSTTSQQLLDLWGYEEEAIQLREYTDLQVDNTSDAIVVIKGGIFNNIMVTKNSLQAHRNIFRETLAVRTNYLAKMINNTNDFIDIIKAILTEAVNTNQYVNVANVGNVIGETYKLISENPAEVNNNHVKVDINGREFFVSVVENWQMPLSIIKTHTALLANTSIAVKLSINSHALNFYLTEYVVAEPSLSLAVSSFCNHVQSCIK